MLARHSLATFVVAVFALSATACSSLTRPDEITVRAEQPAPPPAPAAPAAPGEQPARPAPAAAPGGGG